MSFTLSSNELLARARADLRMGVPVVIEGSQSLVVCAAETIDEARFKTLRDMSEETCLAVTARRALTLKAHAYDGGLARLVLPPQATLAWLQGVADPAGDLMSPMKGPFTSARGGDVATFDLALTLLKSARLLPAALCAPVPDARSFAAEHHLVVLNAKALHAMLQTRSPLHPVIHAQLPMEVSETGKLHVFRPDDGGEEHYAIEVGKPNRAEPVLARLHSACFTGDLMGSLKCDCGPQLRAALAQMGTEGQGILLYMNQEGRGIGLANKMRAYALQDQGYDTVEANHRLGFEDDERDFRLGSDMLKSLGFSRARLLTNNPRKVDMLRASGIDVTERVPLHVGENRHNSAYLATKVAKSGHLK
ncbi:MAG: GTP cyclohydrolase II [Roseobacter sp.]